MFKYNFYKSFCVFLLLCGTVQLLGQKNITRPSIQGPDGYRVNSFSGSLFYERQDVKITSIGPDLDFKFGYSSSMRKKDAGFGYGWKLSYEVYYKVDTANTNVITVYGTEGGSKSFFLDGGNYTAEKSVFDELEEYEAGKFRMTSKEGTQYYFDNGNVQKLTALKDRCDNTLTLSYTDTLLTQVTDHTGRAIDLNWTAGRLTSISNNLFSPARVWTYEYDNGGNMLLFTNPLGHTIEYTYDEDHRLVLVVDENSTPTRIAYQNSGGVKKIASCDVSFSMTYNPSQMRTYMVQEVADQREITTYQFDDNGNVIEKYGNCCGFNIKYLYDEDKNITKREDGNSNAKLYSYDEKGNPLTKTDAAGNTEEFSYDDNYSQVLSHANSLGNQTLFTYDTKGNLTEVQRPLGITESFTYDSAGNILTETDGLGNTSTHVYNSYGYLIQTTFADNASISFTYDPVGNLLSGTDENGNTTTYTYNALNQLLNTTNALGHTTTLAYDAKGNLTTVTDPRGNTTAHEYDGLQNKIATTSPMGNTVAYTYNSKGKVSEVTDPMGNKTKYEYNYRGQLNAEIDALGYTKKYEYDAAGNKITEIDKRGNAHQYVYDSNNKLLQYTDPEGNGKSYTMDAAGNVVSVTDANGNVITIEYDALNRVVQETDAAGFTIQNTYNAVGRLLSRTDRNGNVLSYTYDARGRVLTGTNALGATTTYLYDNVGNLLQETNALGQTSSMTYNVLNQVVTATNALGETATYVYNAVGKDSISNMANGNVMTYVYDNSNRLISQSDQLGQFFEYTFDANGNVIAQQDANGSVNTMEYDAMNRLVLITSPLGSEVHRTYDADGNHISVTKANGALTQYIYDSKSRLVETINADGGSASYSFDAVGNMQSVLDQNGNLTSYSFDVNNRPVSISFPDGLSETFNYDPEGNMLSRTEKDGALIQYTYNGVGRMTSMSIPGEGPATYVYDILGNLTQAANDHATVAFVRDNSNRVVSETLNGKTTSYTFDDANNTQTTIYPNGTAVVTNFDVRSRPVNLEAGGTTLTDFTYNAGNNLISKNYGNGVNTNYTYNAHNRMTSIVTDPVSLLHIQYEYDAANNRTVENFLHAPDRSKKTNYNELCQVVGFERGAIVGDEIPSPYLNETFGYDLMHNRTNTSKNNTVTSYQVNTVNEYLVANSNSNITFSYSDKGEMTFDGTHNYVYNADSKLVGVDSDITYKYDPFGRRVQKNVAGVITNYYYDDKRVIEERNGSDQVVWNYYYPFNFDLLVASSNGSVRHYMHEDVLGSVLAVTDDAGNLVERYEYGAYGELSVFDANYTPVSGTQIDNHYYYSGAELDAETNLYNMKARHYHPAFGRFMQRDPLGYYDDLNMYQYAQSNPINLVDPSGLACRSATLEDLAKKFGLTNLKKKLDIKKRLKRATKKLPKVIGKPLRKLVKKLLKTFDPDLEVEGELCVSCCEETKKKNLNGSITVTAGGGVEVGSGDAIELEFDNAEIEIGGNLNLFVGGTLNLSIDACQNISGGGCLNVTGGGNIVAQVEDLSIPFFGLEIEAGGNAELTTTLSVCVECTSSGCKPKVDFCSHITGAVFLMTKIKGVDVITPVYEPFEPIGGCLSDIF